MRAGELQSVLNGLGRPRVLVIGDLILDRYVSGEVERISPEAPIPVLSAHSTQEKLGGAGNVAANLRAMEAQVEVIGVTGDDSHGRVLIGKLDEIGVETRGCVIDAGRPTTEKTRMLSGVQQVLRVDWEHTRPIDDDLARRIVADLPERVAAAQALILSDYGKGLLTRTVISGAIAIARAKGVPVLVDPKGTDYARYKGATLITPNRREAEEALGRKLGALRDLPAAANELIKLADLSAAVITLGAQGIYLATRSGTKLHVATVAREVFDVTGAGDTVISHIALALGAGLPLETAVHLANHAAGIVVGKPGAASVTRRELSESLEQHERGVHGPKKVVLGADLDALLADWRGKHRRIVMTNGAFDVLHAGHVDYLRKARSHGDVLLVAVNDDASVRRLKGPERPVNPLADRMTVLAALEMVDAVTSFGEDTPKELVELVSPAVLVKGEDWATKGVVGREWVEAHGGEVVLVPLLEGRSTTAIVERLRGGEKAAR